MVLRISAKIDQVMMVTPWFPCCVVGILENHQHMGQQGADFLLATFKDQSLSCSLTKDLGVIKSLVARILTSSLA